ncbi:phosphate/phosphite/phosphonate ABC transporter substrate-binding protein [bacterium]|nr:MAG: phosphate/phosphite/phosphonate ABC transporter substrate-binding protein [bacterium]
MSRTRGPLPEGRGLFFGRSVAVDKDAMRRLARLAAAGLVLAACGQPPPQVSLSDTGPAEPGTPAPAPLRIAISPMESPERTFAQYSELFAHVAQDLGRPVEMIQRQTYSEVVSLVEHRRVDAALVCSGPYVQAHADFGAQILVVPRIGGTTSYQALVIVRRDSPYRGFDDLRGRSFALTDALSTSGMVFPAALARERGKTTETFFGKVLFTKGHDNSVRAVAEGVVDGAAVSSLVYDELTRQSPALGARLRVIARSPPFGNPPVIVHPNLDPGVKKLLKEALLVLQDDPPALAILRKMGIERFVEGDAGAYEEVRRLRAKVHPRAGS